MKTAMLLELVPADLMLKEINVPTARMDMQPFQNVTNVQSTIMVIHTANVRFAMYYRPITCFSYILLISLDHSNKIADSLINWPFCSDDFITSYKFIRS